jgi:hypothetical protein
MSRAACHSPARALGFSLACQELNTTYRNISMYLALFKTLMSCAVRFDQSQSIVKHLLVGTAAACASLPFHV